MKLSTLSQPWPKFLWKVFVLVYITKLSNFISCYFRTFWRCLLVADSVCCGSNICVFNILVWMAQPTRIWYEGNIHRIKDSYSMSQNKRKIGFLGLTGWYFPKLNSKISCLSTSFKKEISIPSNIAKKIMAREYLKHSFICQICVKRYDLRASFRRNIQTILSINSTFFKL